MGAGASAGLAAAVHATSQDELSSVLSRVPSTCRDRLSDALVHERVDGAERPQERVDTTRDQYIDPASLVQILRTKHVRLLKAEFILDWIDGGRGPLPCRQDVPEEGFVDVDALSEQELASLIIISISYCWVSADHPDPECYHLHTLGSLLQCFLKSSFDSAPEKISVNADGGWSTKAGLHEDGAHFGADGRCVGVFLDWTGLYQDKPKGRRTSEENEVFNNALKTINIWYAHVTTIVWMLTSLPAGVQRKDYNDSGWTTFEASVASILTKGTDMLEISDQARRKLFTSDNYRTEYIQLSYDMMSRQSRVPALPDEFDRLIDGKVFTNGADKDKVVKPKYAQTFRDLIPSSPAMHYKGLGLTPENVYKILDLASMHIKKLEVLNLAHNYGINLPIHSFAQLPSLTTLNLAVTNVSGDIGALESLVNLKYLGLAHTQVGGDVGALQALVHLTYLDLGNTQVTGDVGALQALVDLTELGLGGTQVTGDVGKLQSLVKLTKLGLAEMQVCGDMGKLQALVHLTELWLGNTQVTGDVGALQTLVKLRKLSLEGAQVCGDVGALRALVDLVYLNLDETRVTGDVSNLHVLGNLTRVFLAGTQITGDVAELKALVKARLTIQELKAPLPPPRVGRGGGRGAFGSTSVGSPDLFSRRTGRVVRAASAGIF